MRKKVWGIIAVAAFSVAIILTIFIVRNYVHREIVEEQYETMREPESENAQQRQEPEVIHDEIEPIELDIPVDFESLQKTNPDIYGWITIPGTEIDYPIVQSSTDNSYYLNHSAEKTESVCGAIFSENYNSKTFDDAITVLYGHNMRDGSMFAGLHEYEDKVYMENHEDITVYLPDAILKYKVFAAYLSDDKHILMHFNQGETEDNRKAYIDEIMSHRTMKASLKTSANVDENSKILTLSTCHSAGKNYRYLVQAYLAEEYR